VRDESGFSEVSSFAREGWGWDLASRGLGSPCGLTCSMAWQCCGETGTAPVRSPTGALWSFRLLLSSSRPLGNTRKGSAFVLLFLSQRRHVCSKTCLPGKCPPFLFLAFSSGQFAFAAELLRILLKSAIFKWHPS